ncbi:MAG: Trehalose utilization [Pedosphaera sp.]|nr:Trehalose utilization [Pedosphaera sp.]
MTKRFYILVALLALFGLALKTTAADVTKAKKIVLIAGKKSHGPGDHEYEKGVELLKHSLDTSPNVKGIKTEAYTNGWPTDPKVLENASTILLFCDGSDHDEQAHPLLHDDRLATLRRLMKRGVGFVAIHYTVFVPKEKAGNDFLDWIGGYFDYETGTTPNKWCSAIENKSFSLKPVSLTHPISRGLQPFDLHEELYYHLRFRPADKRLTPILSFTPVSHDWDGVVAWAVEREDGGRGFGFTGGHTHKNWENPNVRRMVLNALLWTAKNEVPPQGVESSANSTE